MVSYNHQALAFYAKNSFNKIADLKDWYNIQGKDYDAVLLYKPISKDDLEMVN